MNTLPHEELKEFTIEVYEPAIDPGGHQDVFVVTAYNIEDARRKALQLADAKWPDNKGLDVTR